MKINGNQKLILFVTACILGYYLTHGVPWSIQFQALTRPSAAYSERGSFLNPPKQPPLEFVTVVSTEVSFGRFLTEIILIVGVGSVVTFLCGTSSKS